jgi:cytoskeletal protein RodZ
VQVVLDHDEVSSDDDAPLSKRLRLSSAAGGSSDSAPAVADVAATTKATAKVAADKEVINKIASKEATTKEAAVRATWDSTVPGQAPSSAVGAKRAPVPNGSTPSAK